MGYDLQDEVFKKIKFPRSKDDILKQKPRDTIENMSKYMDYIRKVTREKIEFLQAPTKKRNRFYSTIQVWVKEF